MAEDPTIQAIDRIFDLVDRGVDAATRVFDREQQLVDKRGRREVIEVKATPKKAASKTTATAIACKPHFYIVEATGPKGETIFVVTDGRNARTECSTREFANKILQALEKAS